MQLCDFIVWLEGTEERKCQCSLLPAAEESDHVSKWTPLAQETSHKTPGNGGSNHGVPD